MGKLLLFAKEKRKNIWRFRNKTKWRNWIIFGAVIVVFIFLANFLNASSATRHLKGSTMGTFYTVTYRGDIAVDRLKPALENYLYDIEDQLSNWDENSWISRFNNSGGTDFVPIPEHAYQVLKHYLELTVYTKGALDPTLGELINIWGFGPSKGGHLPSVQTIKRVLETAGVEKLILKDTPPRIAKKHPALHLNLSAITKGYAADVLAEHLESEGITNYVINIGGDFRISGRPGGGSFWTVAIQRPNPESRDDQAYATVNLINASGVATSGDYRNFFKNNNRHYSHILNPKTGQPIQSDLASTTIIAPTSLFADGIATACMVLGLEKAQELIAQMPNVEGFFIQRTKPNHFRSFATAGWPDSAFSEFK